MTEYSADTVVCPIPGLPGYYADTDGHLWSPGRWGAGHRMAERPSRHGYLRVEIKRPGAARRTHHAVHVLVAFAFLGPRPRGFVTLHRNENQTDNRPENLIYGTQAENIRQAIASGRFVHGQRSHLAKLTDEQAAEALRRALAGEAAAAIARDLGVTKGAIEAIRSGRVRKHLRMIPASA